MRRRSQFCAAASLAEAEMLMLHIACIRVLLSVTTC
jgi:hypothetical protein